MDDSILQAPAAQAIDFGYVQGAWRRIEAMRSSEADRVEPPTVDELEEALGEAVQKCDLFAKNWRNRVYRIELANGRLVLGKQLVMGTDAMLQYQYRRNAGSGGIAGSRIARAEHVCVAPRKATAADRVCTGQNHRDSRLEQRGRSSSV